MFESAPLAKQMFILQELKTSGAWLNAWLLHLASGRSHLPSKTLAADCSPPQAFRNHYSA
jgi:hypothetical protein